MSSKTRLRDAPIPHSLLRLFLVLLLMLEPRVRSDSFLLITVSRFSGIDIFSVTMNAGYFPAGAAAQIDSLVNGDQTRKIDAQTWAVSRTTKFMRTMITYFRVSRLPFSRDSSKSSARLPLLEVFTPTRLELVNCFGAREKLLFSV